MEREMDSPFSSSQGMPLPDGAEVTIEMASAPSTTHATTNASYWAGFSAGANFVAGQMGQALNAAWSLSNDIVQRVSGLASPAPDAGQPSPGAASPGDDAIVDLDDDSDASSTGGESSAEASEPEGLDNDEVVVAMHAVLGMPSGESPRRALKRFCLEHLGGLAPPQCQGRLFALAERWRVAPSEGERDAGLKLMAWMQAYGERWPEFQRAWGAVELRAFQERVEAQWQNIGESSLATPQAVVSNLLQAGYREEDLFRLLGMAIGALDRRAQGGHETGDGIGAAQWSALLDQLVQERLQAMQQTAVGFIPEAVQQKVDHLSTLARDGARQPGARPWRFVVGVPLTVLVQKPACIFLGRCMARQSVETLFDLLRESGYTNREIAAVFGVLSTGTLAIGYVYMLLYRSRHPLPQQYRHWRFSTVLMQAGQISGILLAALGPVVAGALVSDVHAKTLRWGGMAAFTASQAYMAVVSKFVRQQLQTGSSGPFFPLLQLNSVPKAMRVRQQVFRDVAGILSAALVTALSAWCPMPADGRTLFTRVISEDFYLMLTDWFSDDPTELMSVLLMRLFPGEVDPATLSISPKDVPNPFGFTPAQMRDGLLEVLDNGCSRVFNGLGDTLSFTAKCLELADQPGAAMWVKWLNLLVKAPISTRRSTLLTVLRTGVGDPRGLQSRACSLLAGLIAGHPEEVDGVPVPTVRDLAPNEMSGLCLLSLNLETGQFRPAALSKGFGVRHLTLPEGQGEYRFFEAPSQAVQVRPYFHQVAEVRGEGHTGCLAAFNMVTMELLGRGLADPEQAYAWLLDAVLDGDGRSLAAQRLSWHQVLAHFQRVHPRAARLCLRRLHWSATGDIQLDDVGDKRRIKQELAPLDCFGLALRRAPQRADVHVLVIRTPRRYFFFSPHGARSIWATPIGQVMRPLEAILAWREQLAMPLPPSGAGLIEVESDPGDLLTQEIDILSLAQR